MQTFEYIQKLIIYKYSHLDVVTHEAENDTVNRKGMETLIPHGQDELNGRFDYTGDDSLIT